jgi:exodeoxyribonuclease V alpha subunit
VLERSGALDAVRGDVVAWGTALDEAAGRGDLDAALAALDGHRLLCAHRTGPYGVGRWSALARSWLAGPLGALPRGGVRYAGEPLLVTHNDPELEVFNGDTGVVVADAAGRLVATFGRGARPVRVAADRLDAVQTAYAMTVHRSQGSQFARVTVVLPPVGSPLATRQTLYTAVTRCTERVRVVGSAAAVVTAVEHPAARASGLRERLALAHLFDAG